MKYFVAGPWLIGKGSKFVYLVLTENSHVVSIWNTRVAAELEATRLNDNS